jgi:two-component system, NarL family, response regulator DevR
MEQAHAHRANSGQGSADHVSVVLVDDHAVVRQGLRLLLESDSTLAVVGEAGSVAGTREVLDTRHVDVVVLDVVLPDGDGIQLCRELRQERPDVACVILTSVPDSHMLLAARLAGASSCLSKDAGMGEVVAAVHAAHRGEHALDDEAMMRAMRTLATGYEQHPLLSGLTEQERQVFTLVGQGLSNQEIADELHLAEKTVKNYVSRLLAKLGMSRRTEAAILAVRLAERRARDRSGRDAWPPPD